METTIKGLGFGACCLNGFECVGGFMAYLGFGVFRNFGFKIKVRVLWLGVRIQPIHSSRSLVLTVSKCVTF